MIQNLKPALRFVMPVLVAVCVVLAPISSSASEQQQAKQYYDAATIIIGGESQDFIIGQGEIIRFASGQSIHLLPGTRIEAGGQVLIEAGVKTKPETFEEKHSVVFNPVASPFIFEMECSFASLPEPEKIIASAGFVNAVIPAQVSNTSKNLLTGKISYNLISNHAGLLSNVLGNYLPILAWGERPETIKVLRT